MDPTTRQLLTVLADLYVDGDLWDCYGIDVGMSADPEDLPPLEGALSAWVDAGFPDLEDAP